MKKNLKICLLLLLLAILIVPSVGLAANPNSNGNSTSAQKVQKASTEIDLNTGKKEWKDQLNIYKKATLDNKNTELQAMAQILIQNRLTYLTNLQTKIQAMENLSAEVKTQLKAEIDSSISQLNSINTQIQSQSDLSQLKIQVRNIFDARKIYSVVAPKQLGQALVAKSQYILGRLTALEKKLTAVVAKMDDSIDKTEIEKLTVDFNAKLTDAKAQLEIANIKFKSMNPANTEAAKLAREEGKTAMNKAKQDLKDAHTILKSIVDKIKANQAKTETETDTNTDTTTSTTTTTTPTTTTTTPTTTTTTTTE